MISIFIEINIVNNYTTKFKLEQLNKDDKPCPFKHKNIIKSNKMYKHLVPPRDWLIRLSNGPIKCRELSLNL